jgi:hypothetical protein
MSGRVWIRITEAMVNNVREFRVYYDGELLATFDEYKEAHDFYEWLEQQPGDVDLSEDGEEKGW